MTAHKTSSHDNEFWFGFVCGGASVFGVALGLVFLVRFAFSPI